MADLNRYFYADISLFVVLRVAVIFLNWKSASGGPSHS